MNADQAPTLGVSGAIAEIEKRNGVVKHTPGPWRISPYNPLHVIAKSRGDAMLADCTAEIFTDQHEPSANAHLIAAAPELFEALRSFLGRYVELVNSGDCGNWNAETEDFVIAARAAVAKAGGNS